MFESSVVRENLMTREGYSPYCGNWNCKVHSPRTTFHVSIGQFGCPCGWWSLFPVDFINRYKKKWGL